MDSSIRLETVKSLSERLQLPTRTIVREVLEGHLPYVNVGGHWRFREIDVAHWLRDERRLPRLRLVEGGARVDRSAGGGRA